MQEIAAYLTFVLATIILIFAVVVVGALSIAIYEVTKWMGRTCIHFVAHRYHESVPVK